MVRMVLNGVNGVNGVEFAPFFGSRYTKIRHVWQCFRTFIIQFVGDHVLGMMVSPKGACDSLKFAI